MAKIYLNTTQMVELFGVTRKTLTVWKGEGADSAYVSRGKWDLKVFLEWWLDNVHETKGPSSPDIQAERLRWERGRADKIELQVQALKGEMKSKDEIHREWAARISLVVSGLNIYQDRLPPLLEGKTRNQMRAIIRKENERLRNWYIKEGKNER